MFWLYLLGTVTILIIALRRVVTRENELKNEAFSKTVAFEHTQSGIAWVRANGAVESMNASLAAILGLDTKDVRGMNWCKLFAEQDQYRLEGVYSEMLLCGQGALEVNPRHMQNLMPNNMLNNMLNNSAGKPVLDLRIVAVHDHKMRFAGHHCLVADRSRERKLEAELAELRQRKDWSARETTVLAPPTELFSTGAQLVSTAAEQAEDNEWDRLAAR